MPRRVLPLNAKQIENWRPDPTRVLERPDGAVPGLWARLAPTGELSWSLNVRVQGVRRRIALGKGLRLAEARRRAEQARGQIADGKDPTEHTNALLARRKAAHAGIGTFETVIATYFKTGPGASLRSGDAAQALIVRIFADHLKRPSLDVRGSELQLAIDAWRSKSSALRVAAYTRPLLRWAAKRGLAMKSDPLEAPPQTPINQRKLTHEEVGTLWRDLGWARHDIAARFILLTAARREEVCSATWAEIDLDTHTWTIPAERRKDTRPNARRAKDDHTIPLSRQGVELLEHVRAQRVSASANDMAARVNERDMFVFVGQRDARLTNWPRWSARAEQRYGFDVTPHALRRTCATLAGDLGQPPHVVSALLGHRVGTALHSGYNQSKYTAEVALALQSVADMLDTLATGRGNIVTHVGKSVKKRKYT